MTLKWMICALLVVFSFNVSTQAKETVSKRAGACEYLVESEMSFTTHPEDVFVADYEFTCDKWKKILAFRKQHKFSSVEEIKEKGLYADFMRISAYRFDKNSPNLIVDSLNRISKEYPNYSDLKNIFYRLYLTRALGDSQFLENIYFSLYALIDESLSTAIPIIQGDVSDWKFSMSREQCGVAIPVFHATLKSGGTLAYGDFAFGFYFDLEPNTLLIGDEISKSVSIECPPDLKGMPKHL